jgi:branched-chain amino acid transport system substrate-binding protein
VIGARSGTRTFRYRATVVATSAVVLAVAACGGSSSGSPGAQGPITIGVSAPLSGANAYVGTDILNGLQLGIDQVNASGGVLGRKIQLVKVDDACDPGQAVSAVKKLISDKVPAVFGPGCSGAALAEMPLIASAQIPMLVSDASNAAITTMSGVGGNEFTWRINADDGVISGQFSKYISQRATSFMAIAENDDFGRGGVTVYQQSLPADGVKFLGAQYYAPGLADFRPLLSAVQNVHPQALLLIMESKDAATLVRQIHELGLSYQIYGRGWLSSEFLTALGDPSLANGIVGADFWAVGMEPSFDAAYQKAYGTPPPPDSAGPYNAAFVMAKAIQLGGGATSAAIERGLSMVNMTLGWGKVQFDSHHQAHPNIILEDISAGEVKILQVFLGGA